MADDRAVILLEERHAGWRWTRGFVGNVAAAVALAVMDRRSANRVYNVGDSGENYTKQHIVELIQERTDKGSVSYVHKTEDPRDYKVSFDKVREVLGFETLHTVPDGITEVMAALDRGDFEDPFHGRYRNVA